MWPPPSLPFLLRILAFLFPSSLFFPRVGNGEMLFRFFYILYLYLSNIHVLLSYALLDEYTHTPHNGSSKNQRYLLHNSLFTKKYLECCINQPWEAKEILGVPYICYIPYRRSVACPLQQGKGRPLLTPFFPHKKESPWAIFFFLRLGESRA